MWIISRRQTMSGSPLMEQSISALPRTISKTKMEQTLCSWRERTLQTLIGNMRSKLITVIYFGFVVSLAFAIYHIPITDGKITVTDGKILMEAAAGPTAKATGGDITTNGDYIVHSFTNVMTTNFIVDSGSLDCEVLIVAGGGGGGDYFGGGGGSERGGGTGVGGNGGSGIVIIRYEE